MAKFTYDAIGVIHTRFKDQETTPIQGVYSDESTGEVEVFPQYTEGLKDLDGFSHIYLIYHFHLAEGYSLSTRPFLDNEPKGLFSIRHYNRPNPIGLSIVRLDAVKGNILTIGEVDIVDGTPLLDIKPYVPEFDIRNDVRNGWVRNAGNRDKYTRRRG